MDWRELQNRQRVFEFGSRFVSYVDEGAGDPVVLLHGIPTWGYLWHRIYPALARTHRVLIADLLGFGYSDKSDRFDRSIARQAEMIDSWLNWLDAGPATIVGHDIGGGVALRLATLFPARVARLCLISPVCYDSWPAASMLQLGSPGTYRKYSASALLSSIKQHEKSAFSTQPDGLLDALLVPYSTEVGKLSLIRDAASLDTNLTAEITPLLPLIDAPALILWGEDDEFQELKYGERLASDIPEARLTRIPGAGHFSMLDKPEEVGNHIAAFLG